MITILQGDCLEKLRELPDGSVHCCVTSPPYDNLRDYDGCSLRFEPTAIELTRVLCDGGVICWNVADQTVDGSETLTSCKQKIFFAEQCGLRVHDTMIYEKLNFSAPEQVRYHNGFEYVFVLSKGKPRTFNPIKDRKNIYAGQTAWGENSIRSCAGKPIAKNKVVYAEWGMRTNVWRGKTRGQEEGCVSLPHPAMMPKWLARDLILSWTNPGDVVLDPMAGSGTVGTEALELGRKAILIELNPKYIRLIESRTNVTPGLQLA